MFDDPSRSGCADRISFRADHRESGSVSVRQADRELSRTGALGRFQWEPATAGAHHQTGEFDVALLVGGSCSGHSSQPSGMAQQVFPFADAPGPEDRQGRDGAAPSGCSVLDVAQGMGLRASEKVRFARGPARTRPWCAVKHRVIDWAARSSFTEEFEVVIMIKVVTEEMHGSD